MSAARRSRTAGLEAASRVVYAGAATYGALFVFAAVLHFAVFETADVDLGHMVQPIWTTLHGHFLETTAASGRQASRLGFHADPFLVLVAPLYWVWSSPLLLPVLQAVAVASGALPVYWLGRKHLQSGRAGAHFAFAYLLFPATQFNAFTSASSFHALSLALPLVLFAVWFLDEDRLVAFSLVALLAATTREEIPLAVGCLGIWYAVRRGRRLFGLSVFAAGLLMTLGDFLYLIPHYSPTGVDPFAGRYAHVGGTPRGMLHTLVTDPLAFVHAVASGHKAVYVALLFGPFLGLWLLEPLLLLGAVPELVINLLSAKADQSSLPFYPAAGVVPFLVAASVLGAARFKNSVQNDASSVGRDGRCVARTQGAFIAALWARLRTQSTHRPACPTDTRLHCESSSKRRSDFLSLCALSGAAVVAVYSPLWSLKQDIPSLTAPVRAAKAHAVALVPRDAAVSASNKLGGHLAGRRYFYVFPVVRTARWIVVDVNDPTYAEGARFRRYVRRYESSPQWRTVFSSQGISVLRKREKSTS